MGDFHGILVVGGPVNNTCMDFLNETFIQKNFRGNGRGKRVVGEFLLSVGRFLNHWGCVKMGLVVR